MRTIPIHVDAARLGAINLGKQGESLACRVRFYAPKWYEEYPDAEYQLFVTPPSEATPYLAQITAEAGTVTWDLQEADTAIPGSGTLELILTDGETKIKSVTYRTTLDKSPSSQEPGSAPDVHPTWWEGAIKKIEAATAEAIGEIDGAFESEKQEATAAIVKAAEDAIASIPADYTTLSSDVSSLKDAKADAITDESARAASHELHAQRGPLAVTLYGKTTETGTGDKSPDNPYTISGVSAAQVHAGGKNLLMPMEKNTNAYGVTLTIDETGKMAFVGTSTTSAGRTYLRTKPFYLAPGTYTVSLVTDAVDFPCMFAQYTNGTVNIAGANWGKTMTFTVKKNEQIDIGFNLKNGVVYDVEAYIQIEAGSAATAYEPYNANVITPPLLPDGSPLHGNGTVDDTVENDVLSGCDKVLTIDGTTGDLYMGANNQLICAGIISDGTQIADENQSTLLGIFCDRYPALTWVDFNTTTKKGIALRWSTGVTFSIRDPEITTADAWKTYLAANPLTVYYRSTDYTPDKDLRVCRVVRKWKTAQVDDFTGAVFNENYITLGSSALTGLKRTQQGVDFCNWFKPLRGGHDALKATQGIQINVNTAASALYIYSSGFTSVEELNAYAAENPLVYTGELTIEENYYTDPLPLRKPDTLTTDTVTVTGSGETAVEYPHDTKHYIDSKISELVTLALASN